MDAVVRCSPFVHRTTTATGVLAVETVSGKTYALGAAEQQLLDSCGDGRELASLSATERELARALRERLLLVDDTTIADIGRATLGELDLEVAGACNAECIFCPRDELKHGRGVGIMREATFQRMLDVFGPYLRFVGFAGIGEPTLNKALPRFVRTLSELRIGTALVTNGSMLTDELVDDLLDAGLGSVQVSFNGNVRASYEEHMVGLDFEDTRRRVERLVARAKGRLPIYVSAIETTRNARELEGFAAYWRALGVEASVFRCHSRGGNIVELIPRRPARPPALVARCGLFNTRSFVSWDGRVLACCHDVDAATQLGDVLVDDAATLIARKLEVMRRREWYAVCGSCDEPARLQVVPVDRIRSSASTPPPSR